MEGSQSIFYEMAGLLEKSGEFVNLLRGMDEVATGHFLATGLKVAVPAVFGFSGFPSLPMDNIART
jgi:hypothetical protein